MGRPSDSYAAAIAVQTPWQSMIVARIPPFRTWGGPAECSGFGWNVQSAFGVAIVALDAQPVRVQRPAAEAEVSLELILNGDRLRHQPLKFA